jgi:hypothetical protein
MLWDLKQEKTSGGYGNLKIVCLALHIGVYVPRLQVDVACLASSFAQVGLPSMHYTQRPTPLVM